MRNLEGLAEPISRGPETGSGVLFLYCTGSWWSGVDDERVKEGKRLIFPGLRSRLSSSGNQPERERERERKRERKTDRNGDRSSDVAKVF